MNDKPNGKFCLYCGDNLTGRREKYCNNAHRQRHKRQEAKERTRSQTSEQSDHTLNKAPNAIALFESVKRDLARAEGRVVQLEIDNGNLGQQLQNEREKAERLNRENGALQAKIDMLLQQNEEPPKQTKSWRDRLFRR